MKRHLISNSKSIHVLQIFFLSSIFFFKSEIIWYWHYACVIFLGTRKWKKVWWQKFPTMNGPVQTQLFYCCAVKMCLSKALWWNQTEGERYTVLLVIVPQNGEWPCLLFSGVTGVLRQLKCLFVSACKLQRWRPCFFQPPGAVATH